MFGCADIYFVIFASRYFAARIFVDWYFAERHLQFSFSKTLFFRQTTLVARWYSPKLTLLPYYGARLQLGNKVSFEGVYSATEVVLFFK